MENFFYGNNTLQPVKLYDIKNNTVNQTSNADSENYFTINDVFCSIKKYVFKEDWSELNAGLLSQWSTAQDIKSIEKLITDYISPSRKDEAKERLNEYYAKWQGALQKWRIK